VAEQRPRVALILGSSVGGVGQHVRSLARGLLAGGHRVIVGGPPETDQLFGFRALGADFTGLDIGSHPTLADTRTLRDLRRLASDTDVVHAHGLRAGSMAVVATKHTPVVMTWHNAVLRAGIGGRVSAAMERFAAQRVAVSLCASGDLLAHVWALGGEDVRPGPVAAPRRSSSRSRAQTRADLGLADRPAVLTVARLHPQKGLDVLVDAAARWRDRTPVPVVLIAGAGPDEQRLREQIARTGAPVLLLGARDDVMDLIEACDVAVVASRWEARQLFAQEVLRSGRPLVATAVGGIPELVGEGACLVAPDDPGALDQAVQRLLDDPDAAAELAGRGRAVSAAWPTEEDTVQQVAAIYAEILGTPP
jgi:glycosyltransferase involved in cell wall biosynthesis